MVSLKDFEEIVNQELKVADSYRREIIKGTIEPSKKYFAIFSKRRN